MMYFPLNIKPLPTNFNRAARLRDKRLISKVTTGLFLHPAVHKERKPFPQLNVNVQTQARKTMLEKKENIEEDVYHEFGEKK